MHRITKPLGALCLLWLSLLLLGACSPAAGNAPTTAPTPLPATPTAEPTIAPTLAVITPAEEPMAAPAITALRIGVNAEFQPFVFLDEQGNLAGFDIELLNALSAAAGFEVSYTNAPFETLLAGVAAGEYDAVISAITVTEERQQQVSFTEPYFESGQALLSYWSAGQGIAVPLSNTTILGVENLGATVRVGVKSGTTGAEFVSSQTEAQSVPFAEASLALDALARGEVDAVVVDVAVIAEYIRAQPQAQLKLVGRPVTNELYAIAVNPARPEVLALLNETLAQLRQDGTYDALVNKWFSNP
jgi:ABC-type amino acid transport substrate-binding protein